MMVRLTAVVCTLLGLFISGNLAQQCFNENNAYRYYSSLSLYPQQPNVVARDNAPAGCQPSMVFMVVRNGRRTPTDEELNNFEQRLPVLRQRILQSQSSQLCEIDLINLQNWNMVFNSSTTDLLTLRGEDEVKALAQRMQNKYPDLMRRRYNDQDFLIRHAYRTDRANTATGFAQGLGFNASVARGPTRVERDLLLQFSSLCAADDNDDDNDDILEDFLEAPEVQRMIQDMTARLGLAPNSLTLDDIDAMYKMCAYDYAMAVPSPWCAVFTNSDLQLLELKEDVISAEMYGYEDEINKLETCVLMKDFVNRLNSRQSQGSLMPAVVAYFAKSETILPFFTSLGLFEDDEDIEIDEDNINSLANRKWRTSLINPFMSNIAVTMYTCQGSGGVPTYSVKVAVNEVPVTLPKCEATFCSMDNLMEMIEDFAEECSFEEICDGVSATSASVSFLALMAVISTLYSCLFS